MKPLRPAHVPPEESEAHVHRLLAQWMAGDPTVRQAFPAADKHAAMACIRHHLAEMNADEQIFRNDIYQVHVRPMGDTSVHLSIKRIDRQPIHDWRDLQAIKNQLLGPECEAVELYPAESRKIDGANQFHLWGFKDAAFRFPFGFNQGRQVSDHSIGGSVNRPLARSRKTKPFGAGGPRLLRGGT